MGVQTTAGRDVTLLTYDTGHATRGRAFAQVQAIADDRGYAYHAGIHGLPFPIGCDNAHGTPYFLPWHRAYLYFFERALRDRVARASLPWWNWAVNEQSPPGIPAPFTDESDTDGEANRWPRRTSRRWHCNKAGAPHRPERDDGPARCLACQREVKSMTSWNCVTSWTSLLKSRASTIECICGPEATWARSLTLRSTRSSGHTIA